MRTFRLLGRLHREPVYGNLYERGRTLAHPVRNERNELEMDSGRRSGHYHLLRDFRGIEQYRQSGLGPGAFYGRGIFGGGGDRYGIEFVADLAFLKNDRY